MTADEPSAAGTVWWRRTDLVAPLSFLALALFVVSQLWLDPNGRMLTGNRDDHNIFLFFLSHGERVIFEGDAPFWSDRLNAPNGVNMMANTAILALSLPLSPITHFFGPGVSVALLITLGLAGTAYAWYWVFSRHLVRSRGAAWIGGLWCGFAPTMVSHANGHVNFVNQYVVPFIVWQVLRLREPGRVWRGGITLGLLVVLQAFINEETLLFTALTLLIFVLSYAAMAWQQVKPVIKRFVAGMAVATVTGALLLGYPLWRQFFGRGTYRGQPFEPDHAVTDALSSFWFARQSLAGWATITRQLSISPTEDNTFFGPFGVVMIVVAAALLWRSVAVRAAVIAGVVLLVMSMGPTLQLGGWDTGIPLPFGLMSHVPILNLVSVTRFAMVPATIAGVLLAMAVDRYRELPERQRKRFRIGMALALVPLFPKPLPVQVDDPLPAFITEGTWREYVAEDRTLVSVPLPEVTWGRTGMRWATLNGMDYRSPRGYFMGPVNPPADDTGSWNAPARYTSDLLIKIRRTGQRPTLTETDRRKIIADLVYWRAAVVVLVPKTEHGDLMRATLVEVLGEPRPVGGVEVWDVRHLPVPPQE